MWQIFNVACNPNQACVPTDIVDEFTVTPGLSLTRLGLSIGVPSPSVVLDSVVVNGSSATIKVFTTGSVVNVIVSENGQKLVEGWDWTFISIGDESAELTASGLSPGQHTLTVVGSMAPPRPVRSGSTPLTVPVTIH